jgi:hypothetical protein
MSIMRGVELWTNMEEILLRNKINYLIDDKNHYDFSAPVGRCKGNVRLIQKVPKLKEGIFHLNQRVWD